MSDLQLSLVVELRGLLETLQAAKRFSVTMPGFKRYIPKYRKTDKILFRVEARSKAVWVIPATL